MKQSWSFASVVYRSWLLVTLLGAYPRPASAVEAIGVPRTQGAPQSQELMNEGAAHYAQGEWQAAYLAYRKAWDLTPHPAVAANMAATEIKLGMYLEAAAHLKYALNHLPPIQAQKRDAVEQQLDRVRARLVAVSLSANLEGVKMWIDGKSIGRTPLHDEILLEPGHHAIRAEYADVTQTRAIDVNAGARVELLFDLSGTGQLARPSTPSAKPQPFVADAEPNRVRTWVLVGGAGVTVIALGIGVLARIQANEEYRDAQTIKAQINSTVPSSDLVTGDTCARRDQSEACDLLYRNVQAVERDRSISTGAFVAAGFLGVATVATALLWPQKKYNARSTVSLSELHVAPWSVPKGYGLSASLQF